jgi:hypothetical protein
MTISFRCGHALTVPDETQAAPRCLICGETVVSRVTVRPPSFAGYCKGPHARFEPLPAAVVDLREKEQTDG